MVARVKASNKLAVNSAVCLVCANSSIRPIKDATDEFIKCLEKAVKSGDPDAMEKCHQSGDKIQKERLCRISEAMHKKMGDAEPDVTHPDIARMRHVCETGDLSVLDQRIVKPEKKAHSVAQSSGYIKSNYVKARRTLNA